MEIFSIVFGVASLILGIMTYQLNNEKYQREKRLEAFREFAKNTIMFDYTYVDAIVIGPRQSGKTSIAQLWTSPWAEIEKITASAVWQVYERDIYEFDEEIRKNPDISMEQTYQPVLRIRVHDYPGENSYRIQAIKKLNEIGEKAVLVFVFHVEFVNGKIEAYRDNASYFSVQFTEIIFNQIQRVSDKVAKAIIVFNKADLLPDDWTESKAIQELKKANRDAIHQIERLFSGSLEYHLTSALTNKGLIRLLGSIGSAAIESKKEQKSFKQKIEQLERRFVVEKGRAYG